MLIPCLLHCASHLFSLWLSVSRLTPSTHLCHGLLEQELHSLWLTLSTYFKGEVASAAWVILLAKEMPDTQRALMKLW